MNKLMGIAGLLGVLVLSGFGHSAVAQQRLIIGQAQSNFGSATLAPGFMPDPRTVPITSGGSIPVSTLGLGPGCGGFATARPDFILRLTGTSPNLHASFCSTGDTTLVVNTARNQWVCNDDGGAGYGLNPHVLLNGATAGQYDIWVGSYRAGENIRGTLKISELGSGTACP